MEESQDIREIQELISVIYFGGESTSRNRSSNFVANMIKANKNSKNSNNRNKRKRNNDEIVRLIKRMKI